MKYSLFPARASLDELTENTPYKEIGQLFQMARAEKGFTIEDVAAKIFIRKPYIAALEAGEFDSLPGRVYAIGFLRNYARLLDLDASEIINRIEIEDPEDEIEQPSYSLYSRETTSTPSVMIRVCSIILSILVILSWYLYKTYISPQPSSTETVLVDAGQLSKPEGDPLPKMPEISFPEVPKILEEQKPVVMQSAPTPKSEVEATQAVWSLKSLSPTWIEIREATGAVLLNRILKTGETFEIPDKKGLILSTGNAGGLELYRQSEKMRVLGKKGEVQRGKHLDQILKDATP